MNEQTPGARSDWLDAGSVAPSCRRYIVTYPHGHKHLKLGDVVVMVETPRMDNCLLRESDMTLHHLQGRSDQYIHLAEVKASNAEVSDRPCQCAHWARSVNLFYLTNHHENCPRYNDSLMDVWKVTVDGRTAYCEHARETAGYEQRDDITITKERMHREVFEHLPEFEGF